MNQTKHYAPQHLSTVYQNAQSLRQSAAAAEKQTTEVEAIRRELEQTRRELKQTRNELADYKAQQNEYHRAEAAKAEVDKKQQRRHEFKLSAFTVCFTLFLEHIPDLVNLVKVAVESIVAFFENSH